MNSIYLNRVQAVGEQLLGQMLVLEDILEELGEIDRIIQEMSFTVEASLLIRKSRAELDKEIYMIHQMSECLLKIAETYMKTEQRITAQYDMEDLWHPRTRFGISMITGLEGYRSITCLRNYIAVQKSDGEGEG